MTRIKEIVLMAIGKFLNKSHWLRLRNRYYLWVCKQRRSTLTKVQREWCMFDDIKAVMDERE